MIKSYTALTVFIVYMILALTTSISIAFFLTLFVVVIMIFMLRVLTPKKVIERLAARHTLFELKNTQYRLVEVTVAKKSGGTVEKYKIEFRKVFPAGYGVWHEYEYNGRRPIDQRFFDELVDNTNEKIDELALEYGKTTEKVIKTAAPAKRENENVGEDMIDYDVIAARSPRAHLISQAMKPEGQRIDESGPTARAVGGSVGTRQSPSHGRIVQTGGFTLRLDDQEFREEIQPGTRPVEKRGKDAVKKPAKKRKPTALKDLPKELKELANSLKGPVQ